MSKLVINCLCLGLGLVFITSFLLVLSGCNLFNDEKTVEVPGCTDPLAYNYNIDANVDDNSCNYYCPNRSHFVFLTTTGGLNWEKRCLVNNVGSQYSSYVVDISITDENNIWMCSENPARIHHSSDSGYSWVIQYQDESKTDFFNYIEMFDEFNGVAMGDARTEPTALILITDDGGEIWNQVTTSSPIANYSGDTWRRIDFVSPDVGYFWRGTNDEFRGIFKTIDGAKTWTKTNFVPTGMFMDVLKFYDENIGFAVYHKDIQRTIDGGDSWTTVTLPGDSKWCYDIEFSQSDPSKVWLLIGNSVWFSQDTGATWTKQSDLAITIDPQDMVITGNEGWIMGRNNQYHSDNATDGIWEELNFNVASYFRFGLAIDGRSDQIVAMPGSVSKIN